MDHPHTVQKSAFHFLSGTLLSRLTGLLREIATASFFGVIPAIAAFFVAYRFSQLLRRLFGEGSLLAGFSPHYEAARKQSPLEAAEFFRDLFCSLTLFLMALIGVIEAALFAWWKWGAGSTGTQEIIYLTMLMLPGVLFLCLYALCSALLQSEKRYFISGAAPVMFNLVFIGVLWWVKDLPLPMAMTFLSLGMIAAFFFQWSMVIPGALRILSSALKGRMWVQVRFFSPALRQMISAMMLTIVGVGAVQINSALDAIFARYASLSGPAYLYYAMRLYQFPLSLFGIALASALLPPLSRAIQDRASDRFRRLLQDAFSRMFSLMFPATIAIFVLGAASVDLIYMRGHFEVSALGPTTEAFWCYGVGLVPAVFVLLLAPAFYAQKDYRTPLIASVGAVVINTVLNALFVFSFDWGPSSVALATSLASVFNAAFLMKKLSQVMGSLFDRKTFFLFGKTAVCTAVAGVMTLALGHFLTGDLTVSLILGEPIASPAKDLMQQVLSFLTLSGFFVLTLLSYAWMLKADHILQIVGVRRTPIVED